MASARLGEGFVPALHASHHLHHLRHRPDFLLGVALVGEAGPVLLLELLVLHHHLHLLCCRHLSAILDLHKSQDLEKMLVPGSRLGATL